MTITIVAGKKGIILFLKNFLLCSEIICYILIKAGIISAGGGRILRHCLVLRLEDSGAAPGDGDAGWDGYCRKNGRRARPAGFEKVVEYGIIGKMERHSIQRCSGKGQAAGVLGGIFSGREGYLCPAFEKSRRGGTGDGEGAGRSI